MSDVRAAEHIFAAQVLVKEARKINADHKLTEMGWEEVRVLRRRAGEKGLSKRYRETFLKLADANERVLRMRDRQTIH